MPRFIQVHFLTSYPSSLLNRDDVGFAKRMPFGGTIRTRVSSQCQKRHWRMHQGAHNLGELGPGSVRSRISFERFVVQPLVKDGASPELARAAASALLAVVLGKKEEPETDKKTKPKKSKDVAEQPALPAVGAPEPKAAETKAVQTEQVTVFGRPELDFLRGLAATICERAKEPGKVAAVAKDVFDSDQKKNLAALRRGAGLDAALFGRMVTSDMLARCDAAVHVAHALTVHKELAEADYFSAVDDLLQADGDLGSGHIGTAELTSGLFYGYVAVDVPLLVSNLEGCNRQDWQTADRTLAGDVLKALVHLVATVSPGAKLGSTAPHAYASLVLVEAGDAQPRTLANAFLRAVSDRDDLLGNAYQALGEHVRDLDQGYGASWQRAFMALGPKGRLGADFEATTSLEKVALWVSDRVRS
ncbi:MAG: type I-E CRISPR-associated protein Cas7/Cse4/CasC [Deltaproteobacteria bacterium]|nr:type I-E CRISPR-associated protein Cas7/Cse4/CasC [Deltaproteobacteria bacterium]